MIYLDSAATTLQKPAAVSNAMRTAMAHMATPGRGGPAGRFGGGDRVCLPGESGGAF